MNESKPRLAKKLWRKSQYANLVRYIPSGVYFARVRIGGKLIRQTLDTTSITVARLRLSDLEKNERANVRPDRSEMPSYHPFHESLNLRARDNKLWACALLKCGDSQHRENAWNWGMTGLRSFKHEQKPRGASMKTDCVKCQRLPAFVRRDSTNQIRWTLGMKRLARRMLEHWRTFEGRLTPFLPEFTFGCELVNFANWENENGRVKRSWMRIYAPGIKPFEALPGSYQRLNQVADRLAKQGICNVNLN